MIAYESVLFPEPFGPMIACTSFVSTSRSTPLTISVPSSQRDVQVLQLQQCHEMSLFSA